MIDINTNEVYPFQRKEIRSIIDYCYASNKIVKHCSFRVDPLSLSDHYPLCMRIGISGTNFDKFGEITPSAMFQLRLHKKRIDEIWLKKFLDRWVDPPEVDDATRKRKEIITLIRKKKRTNFCNEKFLGRFFVFNNLE